MSRRLKPRDWIPMAPGCCGASHGVFLPSDGAAHRAAWSGVARHITETAPAHADKAQMCGWTVGIADVEM